MLWRISDYIELDGIGGNFVAGRWHSAGQAIVYASESSALAMLEVMVHLEIDTVPASFQLIQIEAPDEVASEVYNNDIAPAKIADSITWGNAWLASGRTALAHVPAVVAPISRNVPINPAHPDAARIRVVAHSRWPWDRRLLGK